jgi:hypothetical protein
MDRSLLDTEYLLVPDMDEGAFQGVEMALFDSLISEADNVS